MTTDNTFWRTIARRPHDDLPKLAFADWLDERGDQRAACLRWVVTRGIRPAHDITENTWDWWSRLPKEPDYYPAGEASHAVLPANLFRRLKGRPTDVWKGYKYYCAALHDLGRAWADCANTRLDPLAD